MATLLIVNPNTTEAVTVRLAQRARALAPEGGQVVALTAAFGAPYISDEIAAAVAGHALLDTLVGEQATAAGASAVLIGCFGDPGLFAARQITDVPALGLAEAAMREAARHGSFAIVTGGLAWPPMLRRLAQAIGTADALREVVAVAPDGARMAADPVGALSLLREACLRAADVAGVHSIVIGGAALAGMAATLAGDFDIPLIDSVDAGLQAAWLAADACPLIHTPRSPEWWPSPSLPQTMARLLQI